MIHLRYIDNPTRHPVKRLCYELAKRLREKAPEVGIFVALTGYGQEHAQVLLKAAGFDHQLVKPVDVDNLLRILAEQSIKAEIQKQK